MWCVTFHETVMENQVAALPQGRLSIGLIVAKSIRILKALCLPKQFNLWFPPVFPERIWSQDPFAKKQCFYGTSLDKTESEASSCLHRVSRQTGNTCGGQSVDRLEWTLYHCPTMNHECRNLWGHPQAPLTSAWKSTCAILVFLRAKSKLVNEGRGCSTGGGFWDHV